MGICSYTTSVVAIFNLFAVLGTTSYGQRTIAQCRDDRGTLSKRFWEIELLSVASTLLCVTVWLIYAFTNQDYRLYYIILTLDLVSTAFDIIWFYSGLEQFGLIVYRNAAVKIISIILMFAFVKKPEHAWLYIAILSLGKLIGNITMWIPIKNYIDKPRLLSLDIYQHVKETFAYFIPTAAASVYNYLDKVMIGAFTVTSAENGYYEQTNRVIAMGNTILVSVNTVMSARMSYLFAQGNIVEMKVRLEKTLRFIMTLGIPLAFGIASVSDCFVGWFFGQGFHKVSFLMKLASPLVPLMGLHNYLAALILIPSGQRVRSTKGVIIGAIVNFVLNIFLIPTYQSAGAVLATVASELAICIVYLHMSRDYITVGLVVRSLVRPLICGVAMGVIVVFIGYALGSGIVCTVTQVFTGITVYMALMLLIQDGITRELLQILIRYVSRTMGLRERF